MIGVGISFWPCVTFRLLTMIIMESQSMKIATYLPLLSRMEWEACKSLGMLSGSLLFQEGTIVVNGSDVIQGKTISNGRNKFFPI
ncbi:hypothetical protein GLYMA_06G193067v4 [Glycine max]|nr:hypothetical protein GLYMA_06G193067v4 [Glycine max]KAH1126665.1 hypothetical protein GYH30_015603 [Glycine max]